MLDGSGAEGRHHKFAAIGTWLLNAGINPGAKRRNRDPRTKYENTIENAKLIRLPNQRLQERGAFDCGTLLIIGFQKVSGDYLIAIFIEMHITVKVIFLDYRFFAG